MHNFRGYKNIEVKFDDNFSVIIGKNDVGKSTILEALEIFFNSEQVKMDSGDLRVNHDDNDSIIRISCEFFVEDDKILVDSMVSTNLKDEYLYNSSGLLEICCESDGGKKPKYFINAFYPKLFKVPLVQLKISELKKELDKQKENILDYESINKSIASLSSKSPFLNLSSNSFISSFTSKPPVLHSHLF